MASLVNWSFVLILLAAHYFTRRSLFHTELSVLFSLHHFSEELNRGTS